jgi:hypothetical protein
MEEEIHPLHALQSDGRTTALFLQVERADDGDEVLPRDDLSMRARNFSRRVVFFLFANSAWQKLIWWVTKDI